MCGRFAASAPIEEIVEQFSVDDISVPGELLPGPRFNVAPQDDVVALRESPAKEAAPDRQTGRQRRLAVYKWGLVPSWAKDPKIGVRAFNARADTLTEKSMFKTALSKRRLIIPADAFYEWQRLGGKDEKRPPKQPWCFTAAGGGLLALAGLYELWHDDSAEEGAVAKDSPSSHGGWLRSCTVITTDANEMMAPIHDRMPVVLRPEDYERWLSPGPLEPEELHELFSPVEEDFLCSYRVGPEVNNSRSEGASLMEPLAAEANEPR